jgi:hypothetical protein
MKTITELQRLDSPAPKPTSLAWDGSILWMGSRAAKRIYAINPVTWTVIWEAPAPGTPYGMTAIKGELRVLCGETAEDHRFVRRCIPMKGFDAEFGIPCRDDTGSQLGYDGSRLHMSQWYLRKVLALGAEGWVERLANVPHGICGQVFVGGFLYLLTTDEEERGDYWVTRVDLRPAMPEFEDLVRIPFPARALAFDGTRFWTNHREQNQIVSFARPD